MDKKDVEWLDNLTRFGRAGNDDSPDIEALYRLQEASHDGTSITDSIYLKSGFIAPPPEPVLPAAEIENAVSCLHILDPENLTIPDVKQAISWLEDWIDAKQSADCKIKFPAYEIEETETECEACKIQLSAESEGAINE